MNKTIALLTVAVLGSSLVAPVHTHPATERYIPIGYWQTVSGKETYIGEIRAVATADHSLTVTDASGTRTVVITDRTRIWLDRSHDKLTNLKGTYEDCRPGRTVEVRLMENSTTEATWIKVRVSGDDAG